MKKTLLSILPLLLIFGCSKPETINYETKLVERDGVFYTKNTNKPYTGKVFSLYGDGNKKDEGILKDGIPDGLTTAWYENGQKSAEVKFKDGKKDGLLTAWDENGKKVFERTYKDGKLIDEKVPPGITILPSKE
ncbi:MAG TPA: hypothetical protein QGH36_06350 [Candidatus Marinimicrobia bacterium]|jgi:antitoxin component YwqK of YwqJK toxin-antitoxin module|nr:hypothetical protein [Candidatus Neomarinimicrobiota bacterium]HJL63800.1 hypothetical protein [Candidatus Neomarinimicrobiota bacterium]|tara:strand:+ start:107 stop:508 length:402 start_codon:yes stop_codon:yes gene_type:complete